MYLHPQLVLDAERVLDEAGCPHERIYDVQPDYILYENRLHKARTLWIRHEDGTERLRVKMVEGFPISPPDGWPGK